MSKILNDVAEKCIEEAFVTLLNDILALGKRAEHLHHRMGGNGHLPKDISKKILKLMEEIK